MLPARRRLLRRRRRRRSRTRRRHGAPLAARERGNGGVGFWVQNGRRRQAFIEATRPLFLPFLPVEDSTEKIQIRNTPGGKVKNHQPRAGLCDTATWDPQHRDMARILKQKRKGVSFIVCYIEEKSEMIYLK